jgi:hypothetical protein
VARQNLQRSANGADRERCGLIDACSGDFHDSGRYASLRNACDEARCQGVSGAGVFPLVCDLTLRHPGRPKLTMKFTPRRPDSVEAGSPSSMAVNEFAAQAASRLE